MFYCIIFLNILFVVAKIDNSFLYLKLALSLGYFFNVFYKYKDVTK